MFGNRRSRKHQAERLAGQAWDNLSAAVESAGNSTRSAGRRAAHVYDDASDRVGSSAKEARRRASAAYDALSGKKPHTPWRQLAVVAAIGAVIGWVVTTIGRQFAPRLREQRAQLTDTLTEFPQGTFPEDVNSELLKRP